GSAKGYMDTHLVRLANAFGTPNVVSADHVCHVPRMLGAEYTFGFYPVGEIDHPPACIIGWGVDHAQTRFYKNRAWRKAQAKGTRLIVIDPLKTPPAKSADVWLQLRPGTDLALALGLIHVVIDRGLYDKAFVEKWTVGFEILKKHVREYTPERVSGITWVPADKIVECAELYARNRPGYIEFGNALDHTLNSFQASRAISILIALNGDLDVPGGEVESHSSGLRSGDRESTGLGIRGRWSSELELRDLVPEEKRKSKVGPPLLPDFRYVSPQAVLRSILSGEPYRVSAGFVLASNPLSSWPNIRKVYEAFNKLDFLAVSDMFMTPTAALADIVFPAASYLEFDGIQMPPPPGSTFALLQQGVSRVGQCRSDHEIINALAHKMGLGQYFWKDINEFWDYILEPIGMTFDEFRSIGRIPAEGGGKSYRKYEKDGFKTQSGKVELYSTSLEELGFDPLPVYRELPDTPFAEPGMGKDYPLICTTRKLAGYRHSGGRQIPGLRRFHPDPLVMIHPETATKHGIKDGEWVYVETRTGRIKQKAKTTNDIDSRVILADHAWWFPEKGKEAFYGWDESNYNVLTNEQAESSREVDSFNIRGIACRIYKVRQ
ncbi:MAG: molybdopterin-dependent oxidoreductase, partial [Deltaproteobacteria bacterium]|nr:molybdopterin-dependent oxidoreductase [Deltaproteobacteria bacterium]